MRAVVDLGKADHRGGDVVVAARIEQRLAGGAAGTPIFGDAVIRGEAEGFIECPVIELAQRLLIEDRNFPPFIRVVEPIQIDIIELAAKNGARRACSTARRFRVDCKGSISARGRSRSGVMTRGRAHLSFPLGIHPVGQMLARAAASRGIAVNWAGSSTATILHRVDIISSIYAML